MSCCGCSTDAAPSGALRLLEGWGLLPLILPELTALRGCRRRRSCRATRSITRWHRSTPRRQATRALRLAALLHDVGKATTRPTATSSVTIGWVPSWRPRRSIVCGCPSSVSAPRSDAIRHHMYAYDDSWTDAAVRRFIRRVGEPRLALLFALRRADNAASGVGPAGEENQVELERRIAIELARSPDLLIRNRLAIDGNDLQSELGYEPGPRIGARARSVDGGGARRSIAQSHGSAAGACPRGGCQGGDRRHRSRPRWLISETTLLQSAVRAPCPGLHHLDCLILRCSPSGGPVLR